jgi:hypothetical protein
MARKDKPINVNLFRLQESNESRGNPFLTIQEKRLCNISSLARRIATAIVGEVVSKPMAKKTTFFRDALCREPPARRVLSAQFHFS